MIPKIIHYCWFGNNPLPTLAKKCLDSWSKYCPDYELKLWNEETFDLNSNDYTREAYSAKKYAFITDYVRLWAIAKFGGIYMDTDVEVLKPLDRFLNHPAFSGFEGPDRIPTGIMGSEPNGIWALRELEYYQGRHFIKDDGTFDLTTNVVTITNNLVKDGFKLNDQLQDHKGIIVMYPHDYFCPKQPGDVKINITENTYTIHHFDGSWMPASMKRKKLVAILIQKYIPWLLPVVIKLKKIVGGY